MALYLRTTLGVDRDLALLPFFLEHYRNLGVKQFLVILHARSVHSKGLSAASKVLAQSVIEPADIWVTDSWNTGDNAFRHRKLVSALPSESWIISADIDEFHDYPQHLEPLTESLGRLGYDHMVGRLVQRVSRDFRLHRLNPSVPLRDQFPVETDFRIGNPGKVVLHRNYLLTTPGHHAIDGPPDVARAYPQEIKVHHYKWYRGVDRKYTDPSLMAHHSETWEFAAYDAKIRRNFRGWGRIMNVLTHTPALRPLIDQLQSVGRFTKRAARQAIKKNSMSQPTDRTPHDRQN